MGKEGTGGKGGILLGWKRGDSNFIFGGMCGYSWGKERRARKKPPKRRHQSLAFISFHSQVFAPRNLDTGGRGERTTIQLHIIRNHQHNLPLEHVIIHQTTAYPRDIFAGLHLLQLAREHAPCRCGGHFSLYDGSRVCRNEQSRARTR